MIVMRKDDSVWLVINGVVKTTAVRSGHRLVKEEAN